MTSIAIDLTDLEYRLNPWPLYGRLRDEAPVHHVPEGTADGEDFYVVSRYADVAAAIRDKATYSNQVIIDERFNVPVLVNRDAPEHTRLRQNANHAFNARLVRTLGDWAAGIIDEMMAGALSRDRVEWIDAFAAALPLQVVSDMLGIPHDRKNDFRRWTQAVMDMFAVAAGLDPDEVPGFFEDLLEFGNYMDVLAAQRKGKPNRGDVLAELVVQHEAGNLSKDELVVMAWSFIAAGYETTMNLLSGGLHLLLTEPALAARLRADPDLTQPFIEEYLRLYSPIQWTLRRPTTDVVLHDVTIPKGALVHLVIGAANRDPRKFDRPDEFDLDRPNKGEHLGFGAGTHYCPGSALARLLSGLAFRAYAKHLDALSLDPDQPARLRTRQGAYGYETLNLLINRGN